MATPARKLFLHRLALEQGHSRRQAPPDGVSEVARDDALASPESGYLDLMT